MTDEVKEAVFEIVAADAIDSITRAEVDLQISTAKKYPRDIGSVKKRMIGFATLDEETAASCFYTLPRAGKTIQGPSVRLAEIAAASYGNIRSAARVVANDGKTITAQGICHDLENNVCIAVEVRRRITDKQGHTFSDDMQVVTGNAACAIALRNSMFKVIPMALIKPVYEMAKRVAVGDATTLKDRRQKAIEHFAKMGVRQNQILALLKKANIESLDLADVETLIGLSTAIKDGDTTIDEAFPSEHVKPASEQVRFGDKEKPPADDKPLPPRATPLEGLRVLLATSKIAEKTFVKYMIAERKLEPKENNLEKLSPEKLKELIDSFAEHAPNIEKEF